MTQKCHKKVLFLTWLFVGFLKLGGLGYQCFGWMQQSEEKAEDWTEKAEDAETALGCTAHTRLAQQLLKSVSGWVSVHILSIHMIV